MPKLTDLPGIGKKRAKKLESEGLTVEKIAQMTPKELKKYLPRMGTKTLMKIIEKARELTGIKEEKGGERVEEEKKEEVKGEKEIETEIKEFSNEEELYEYLKNVAGEEVSVICLTAQYPDTLKDIWGLGENVDVVWISELKTGEYLTIAPGDYNTLKEFLNYIAMGDNKIVVIDSLSVINEHMPPEKLSEILAILHNMHKEKNKNIYVVMPQDIPSDIEEMYRNALLSGIVPIPSVAKEEEKPEEVGEKLEEKEMEEKKIEAEKELPEEAKELLKLPHISVEDAEKLYENDITLERISLMTPTDLREYLPEKSMDELGDIIETSRKIVSEEKEKKKEEEKKVVVVEHVEEEIEEAEEKKIERKKIAAKVKRGFVNGNGIVTEGGDILSVKRIIKAKPAKIIISTITMLLVLASLIPIITLLSYSQNAVVIDGKFDDWKSIGGFEIGNITFKVLGNKMDAEFYIRHTDMFKGMENIFIGIDEDANFSTGYKAGDLGLDRLVILYGWNGTVKGSSINCFKMIEGGYTLSSSSGLIVKWSSDEIEGAIRLENYSKNCSVILIVKRNDAYISTPPLKVFRTDGIMIFDTNPQVIPNNYEVRIADVKFSAEDYMHINGIKICYDGAMVIGATLIFDNKTYDGSVYPSEKLIYFDINETVKKCSGSLRMAINGNPQDVFRIRSVEVNASGNVEVINKLSGIYIQQAPSIPRVDGAFGEWTRFFNDEIGDLSSGVVYSPNIDIVRYSAYYNSSTNNIFFYLEVNGMLLGGDYVPIIKTKPVKDSDRDTVPDSIDPMPNDFNNDGISDSQNPYDVDGDGIKDYPWGNDMWLNTTIPNDPSFGKYAGKNVSVYIGPPIEKPLNGEDKWVIYVDSDSNPSTGYVGYDFVGAEHKIVITGEYGKVDEIRHYRWFGDWVYVDKPEIFVTYDKGEISVNMQSSATYRIGIFAYNWMNLVDYALAQVTSVYRATPSYSDQKFYLHGRYDSKNFLYMNWTEGTNELITTLNNSNPSIFWIYPHRLSQDYTINNATAYIYLDPNPSMFGDIGCTEKFRVRVWRIWNSTTYFEMGASNWITISQWGDPPADWYTFYVNLNETVIPQWWVLGVTLEWYDDGDDDTLDVYYNSTTNNSRIVINTTSLLDVKEIWTEDRPNHPTQYFIEGQRMNIFANVTDPLGGEHIVYAEVSVISPNGTYILNGEPMNIFATTRYGRIFNYSFELPVPSWVGTYTVVVTAWDYDGVEASNTTVFYINSSILIQPKNKIKFVGQNDAEAYIHHLIMNKGGGRDIVNIKVEIMGTSYVKLYWDRNGDGVIGSDDILVGEGNQGSWTSHNDTDGDGCSDITIDRNDTAKILLDISFSGKYRADVREKLNITLYSSFTGDSTSSTDLLIVRSTEIKTLYCRGPTDNMYLYPKNGNTDEIYAGADINAPAVWTQNNSFANDFVLSGDIVVHLWVDRKGARTGTVYIYLDDYSTEVGSATFSLNATAAGENVVNITPKIPEIPAGRGLILKFYGDKKCDVYYNSSAYPSRIDFVTPSYIHVKNITTYLGGMPTSNFSAGDTVTVRANISDPFGGYDIDRVEMTITDPNGTSLTMTMSEEYDNGSYVIYRYDYTLPPNATVGLYNITVIAYESNGVNDTNYTQFKIFCNITINPNSNSSTENDIYFYFNHTITNSGDGYDCVDVFASSSNGFRIDLYLNNDGTLIWLATDNDGDGIWDSISATADHDGDGVPDTGWLAPGSSVTITVKVTLDPSASTNDTIRVRVRSYSICTASATDQANYVPEIGEFIFTVFFILPLIIIRKFRICRVSKNS